MHSPYPLEPSGKIRQGVAHFVSPIARILHLPVRLAASECQHGHAAVLKIPGGGDAGYYSYRAARMRRNTAVAYCALVQRRGSSDATTFCRRNRMIAQRRRGAEVLVFLKPLGDCRKKTYRMAPDFRSPSRSDNVRIVALCERYRDTEGGRKDKPVGMFFDRNRLEQDGCTSPTLPRRFLLRHALRLRVSARDLFGIRRSSI
jgi:hypothetical protein